MGTIFATRGVLRRSDNTEIVFGRGSAPDPAGGPYDAPPDPLVGWGGGYPLPIPHPLDAFGVSLFGAFGVSTPRTKSLVTALDIGYVSSASMCARVVYPKILYRRSL